MNIQTETAFETKLARLVADEFPKMSGDLHLSTTIIEKLGWTLAMAIAFSCEGHGPTADKLLMGAEAYMESQLPALCRSAAAIRKAGRS